jgi:hypothetical protein
MNDRPSPCFVHRSISGPHPVPEQQSADVLECGPDVLGLARYAGDFVVRLLTSTGVAVVASEQINAWPRKLK